MLNALLRGSIFVVVVQGHALLTTPKSRNFLASQGPPQLQPSFTTFIFEES
jgi:hypothetical protein